MLDPRLFRTDLDFVKEQLNRRSFNLGDGRIASGDHGEDPVAVDLRGHRGVGGGRRGPGWRGGEEQGEEQAHARALSTWRAIVTPGREARPAAAMRSRRGRRTAPRTATGKELCRRVWRHLPQPGRLLDDEPRRVVDLLLGVEAAEPEAD